MVTKNNLLHSLLALLALCTAGTLHAGDCPAIPAGPTSEIPLNWVRAVTPANGDTVTVGTSRIMVSMRLGTPNGVLADGSWFYSDYSAQLNTAGLSRSGTLVVCFTQDRVTSLALVDNTRVKTLLRGVAADQLPVVR